MKIKSQQCSYFSQALFCALGLALLIAEPCVQAQSTWPNKPVTLVVPFATGGTTDILARAIGQKLTENLKQAVIIENKAGAGGTLAAGVVAKMPADGYTLLMSTIAHTMAPNLYKSLSYDFEKDFDPIGMVAITPNVLIVNNNLPVKSVGELIAYIKAHPGEINYGSAGSGSTEHLAGELFGMMIGGKISHVPYKGGAPMMTDLMGGQIQMSIETSPSAHPQVVAGKVRALAVTTMEKSAAYPGIPTLNESGVKGYDFITWFALMAPRGTPATIESRLTKELGIVLNDPGIIKNFDEQGVTPGGIKPAQMPAFIKSETQKWAKVVQESGARVD
jgi:tripartite-type tricarboxylate transporter receptor subunit TctC